MPNDKMKMRSRSVQATNKKEVTLEYKKDKRGQWYWTLTAKNGEQVLSCFPETYVNRSDMIENVKTYIIDPWEVID